MRVVVVLKAREWLYDADDEREREAINVRTFNNIYTFRQVASPGPLEPVSPHHVVNIRGESRASCTSESNIQLTCGVDRPVEMGLTCLATLQDALASLHDLEAA
jgi:hypothetical protein